MELKTHSDQYLILMELSLTCSFEGYFEVTTPYGDSVMMSSFVLIAESEVCLDLWVIPVPNSVLAIFDYDRMTRIQ